MSTPNFFRDVIYATAKAPWDIGKAQPALARAAQALTGHVFDVGCGLGDNARWVATLPAVTRVTAVDLAPLAISEAIARGVGAAAPISFSVQDVFEPGAIAPPATFDAILDSAVFHCIGDDAAQRRYLAAVTPLVRVGGRAVLCVFSNENDAATWRGPRCIAPAHARELWEEAGWFVDTLETDVRYLDVGGRCGGLGGHALLMTATRQQ